jgi:hypothetical protein
MSSPGAGAAMLFSIVLPTKEKFLIKLGETAEKY